MQKSTTSTNTGDSTLFKCGDCSGIFPNMDIFRQHDCVSGTLNSSSSGRSTPSVDPTDTPSSGAPLVWNRSQTLLLIDLFKTLEDQVKSGRLRKKALWEKIAKKMYEVGHRFTGDQVAGRWKSLVRAYKNVKDNNKKSGAGNKTFEFETDLDELFENDPTITPKYTLSSATNGTKRNTGDEDPISDEDGDRSQNEKQPDSSSCLPKTPAVKKARKANNTNEKKEGE